MKVRIYIEGGGDSKELHARCRRGFRKLLEKSALGGTPGLVACGGRSATFDDFEKAHNSADSTVFIAMLVDSEEPVADVEETWNHLTQHDQRRRPQGAHNEQVLFMTTCMETWIVTDRVALRQHYGSQLQESALPSLNNMEGRTRLNVQHALKHATETVRTLTPRANDLLRCWRDSRPRISGRTCRAL